MIAPDPVLTQIAARFDHLDVARNRGGYTLLDRRNGNPIARLRPIPQTDRFELLYWSAIRERWRTFGNLGRLKLTPDEAYEIIETEPIFRLPSAGSSRFIFR